MADTIYYVDPDATGTGDGSSYTNAYTSLNAAVNARAATVGAGDRIIFRCQSGSGTADTTPVVLPDTLNGLGIVRIEGTETNLGCVWNTDNYRLEIANTRAFYSVIANHLNLELVNLQINNTIDAEWETCAFFTWTTTWATQSLLIDRCIFDLIAGSYRTNTINIDVAQADAPVKVRNSYIRNRSSSTANPSCLADVNGGTLIYVHNNTFHGYSSASVCRALEMDATILSCKNNIFYNLSACITVKGGETITDNNNSTNIAQTSSGLTNGNNNRFSQTFTFDGSTLNITSADAGAKDYGEDLSSDANLAVTEDIRTTARSGSFDIGAYETSGGSTDLEKAFIIGDCLLESLNPAEFYSAEAIKYDFIFRR
jgi:hypothetical protein